MKTKPCPSQAVSWTRFDLLSSAAEAQADSTPQVKPFGFQTRRKTAEDFQVSERTIIRWERSGLPVTCIGHLRLHDPVAVGEWLRAHTRTHRTPQRGRPKKAKY
jgi:hypothetical protein